MGVRLRVFRGYGGPSVEGHHQDVSGQLIIRRFCIPAVGAVRGHVDSPAFEPRTAGGRIYERQAGTEAGAERCQRTAPPPHSSLDLLDSFIKQKVTSSMLMSSSPHTRPAAAGAWPAGAGP